MTDGLVLLAHVRGNDLDLEPGILTDESVIDPDDSHEFPVVAVILSAATTAFDEYLARIKYLLLFN